MASFADWWPTGSVLAVEAGRGHLELAGNPVVVLEALVAASGHGLHVPEGEADRDLRTSEAGLGTALVEDPVLYHPAIVAETDRGRPASAFEGKLDHDPGLVGH